VSETEATYRRIEARVRYTDADDDWDYTRAMRRLTKAERALWTTRFLEGELADGGWYLVFADEREWVIKPAIRAYELLGLPAYAAHLRQVIASGYGDASTEDEGERLDEAFATLSGADEAREAFIAREGLAG
jgi:hypothetical protein